ncbi:MAG: SAF domain-containing protein [Thiotrichales bacterium]
MAAIAKRELKKGEHLPYAIGSFAVRGEAIRVESCRDHVPIGILENAVIKQSLEPGQIVTWDDVELPESLALNICREIFI